MERKVVKMGIWKSMKKPFRTIERNSLSEITKNLLEITEK